MSKKPSGKKTIPKNFDFGKLKKAGNANERESVDQQTRSKPKPKTTTKKPVRGQRTATNKVTRKK